MTTSCERSDVPDLRSDQWERVKATLDAALALPVDDRAAYVDDTCADDVLVRDEVRSLLDAHNRASLDCPFTRSLGDDGGSPSPVDAQRGRRLGPYRLLEPLGEGGMGTVHLAERADGLYRRKVAVKIMRHGLRAEDERRFEAERRILARLDHPRIARMIDAGTTPEHQPYLVMDYAAGRPLLEACDERRLSVRERLEVFLAICDAVQYAHRHLVVHRDLKPSNIVLSDDGDVCLLDFGIAKLLEGDPDGAQPLTRTGMRTLTLEYASPEQLLGEPITAGADIYALGLLLYELLCGHRPFGFTSLSLGEVEDRICRRDPPPPSRRVGEVETVEHADVSLSAIQPRGVSAARSTTPARLTQALKGDLDVIVMKALRKEPEQRYHSADQLAEDVQHHLRGVPVHARPATLSYLLSRYVRRHRVILASALLVTAALAGGLAATLHQAREARSRFEQVRSLSNTLLFDLHDEIRDMRGTVRMRQLLVSHAIEQLDDLRRDAADDPSLLAEVAEAYQRIGEIQGDPSYTNLGDLNGARHQYEHALKLWERLVRLRPDDPDARRALGLILGRLALLSSWGSDLEGAMAHSARGLEVLESLVDPLRPDPDLTYHMAKLWSERAWILIWSDGIEEGNDILARQEPVLRGLARDHPEQLDFQLTYWDHCNYAADGYRYLGKLDEARTVLMAGRTHLNTLLMRLPDHPRVLTSLRACLIDVGEMFETPDPAFARGIYREGTEIARRLVAADPEDQLAVRDLGRILGALGQIEHRLGDGERALSLLAEALDIKERQQVADPKNRSLQQDLSVVHWRLRQVHVERGEFDTALKHGLSCAELIEAMAATGDAGEIELAHLAQARGHVGQIHRAMADRAETDGERRRHLEQALDWYERGLAIFDDQKARGVFLGDWEVFDGAFRREKDEVSARLAGHAMRR